MTLINKGLDLLREIKACWRTPAKGDYVAYKEYLMLSLGWLGMRLATVFGIGFGVNDAFTAMTLHMTHRDLLIVGYICTAIGYAVAPLNAYIIDNLRSRVGKYKVYVKLGVPAGILSLCALFFPYERMGYIPMVVSLFLIGQIQGYVQGWYSTGVSNLVYVISPNSKERVRIMMVSSLVHNFAPSLTGLIIPVLSDKLANGDLYNINTYRMVYPAFIIVGVALSMTAYFGVKERIVQPRSQMTGVGFSEALRAVAHNKLFWIKCTDSWNNFMEDSKNVLMQWLFYYGKVGSMTMYGIMDTVSYNSSMWAMLFSPWLIDKLGKRGFKLVKNISQVFITLGLALTYKKNLVFIGIFYFLNRFWETTEVIDRSIESDIRDYQQYISGERIDGAFGVVESYVGGAVGAVTNLFIPYVYKKNGFDGTDYSVLSVYGDNGVYNENNVLYKLLDNLLKVSLVGAIIDVIPWFFYDLSEAQQKSVIRIIRIRSAIEDSCAGVVADDLYCEACEAVSAMHQYEAEEKKQKLSKNDADRKTVKETNRRVKEFNEEVEIAVLVKAELERYTTEFGTAFRKYCEEIVAYGENEFFKYGESAVRSALALPQGANKEEKNLRAEAIRNARAMNRSAKSVAKHYPGGVKEFDSAAYEAIFNMPEKTKQQRAEKRVAEKNGNKERKLYGNVMKPYLFFKRHTVLAAGYDDIDSFTANYDEISARLEKIREQKRFEDERATAARKADVAKRTLKK